MSASPAVRLHTPLRSRDLVWESDGLLPPLVFPADGDGAALDAAVLVAMFVVLRLLAYALLRLRTRAPV